MIEPLRLLEDANAPSGATSLLRSLSAPEPLGSVKAAELGNLLASTAGPAAVAAAGTALWIKAAVVLSVASVAGVWIALRAPAPSAPQPPSARVAQLQRTQPVNAPPSVSEPVVAAATPEVVKEAAVSSVRARPSTRDNLAEEETLLEQARRVAVSSPAQAQSLLQQYQRRFPTGQLNAERMFLSVDVLSRLGDTSGARRQADALIKAFPTSVYAAQVKNRSSSP